MKTALIPAFLFLVVLVVACGNDNNNQQQGQPKVFNLTLTVANETPPCAGAGASATGTAVVTIAADNSSVKVDITYSGLSGTVNAGHIHFGGTTAAGPVVLPFGAPLNSPISKTLTSADYVAGAGTPPDFGSFVTALRGGGAGYVNLHTTACPLGEIRAEIQ